MSPERVVTVWGPGPGPCRIVPWSFSPPCRFSASVVRSCGVAPPAPGPLCDLTSQPNAVDFPFAFVFFSPLSNCGSEGTCSQYDPSPCSEPRLGLEFWARTEQNQGCLLGTWAPDGDFLFPSLSVAGGDAREHITEQVLLPPPQLPCTVLLYMLMTSPCKYFKKPKALLGVGSEQRVCCGPEDMCSGCGGPSGCRVLPSPLTASLPSPRLPRRGPRTGPQPAAVPPGHALAGAWRPAAAIDTFICFSPNRGGAL